MKQEIIERFIKHLEELKEEVSLLENFYYNLYNNVTKVCDDLEDLRDELNETKKN